MPKKIEEVPVAPTQKFDPLPYITIGSMEVPITHNYGPTLIEGPTPMTIQNEATSVVTDVEKEKHAERDPKYL